jgi:hypothetical protein
MIEHVTHLLAAYHDGELQGRSLNMVKEHLELCEQCMKELEEFQNLTNLLALNPEPEHLTRSDRFVAQVALRMPRYPKEPAVKRVFNFGWQATPIGILGVWAFVQSLLVVSGVVYFLMRLGLNLEPFANLQPSPSSGLQLGLLFGFEGESLAELGRTALDILGNGGPLGWGPTLYLALMLGLGLLYCSWMASWWIRRQGHRVQGNYK